MLSPRVVAVLVGVIWGLVAVSWAVLLYLELSRATEARRQEVATEKAESNGLSPWLLAWRVFARGVVIGVPTLFVVDGLLFRIGILYSPGLTLSTGSDRALQIAGVVISAAGLAILILVGPTLSVTIYALATHDRELLTTGAHRYVRHPFYIHFVLLPLGLFLLTLNYLALPLLLLYSGIWEPKLLITEMREEEAEMRRAHGEAFERYAARTGRFLPRVRRP